MTFNKKSNKFQAVLNNSGIHVHLGTFSDEADAARAFDKAALMTRGLDKAKINFPVTDYLDENGIVVEDVNLRAKIDAACDPNRVKRKPPAGSLTTSTRSPQPHNLLALPAPRGARGNSQSIEALLSLANGYGGTQGIQGSNGILEALLSSQNQVQAAEGSLEGGFFDVIESIRRKLHQLQGATSDGSQVIAPPPEILFILPDPATRVIGVAFSSGTGKHICVLDAANGEPLAMKPFEGSQSSSEELAELVVAAGQDKQTAATAASLTATLNQATAVMAGGEVPAMDEAQGAAVDAFNALLAAIQAGDASLNLEQHLSILTQLGFTGAEGGEKAPGEGSDVQNVGEKRKAEDQFEDSRGGKRDHPQEEP